MSPDIIYREDHKDFIGENGNKIIGVQRPYKEIIYRAGEDILMNNRGDIIGKGGGGF